MKKQYKVTLPDGEEVFYNSKPSISSMITININGDSFEYDADFFDASDIEVEEVEEIEHQISDSISFVAVSQQMSNNYYKKYYAFRHQQTNETLKVCGITEFESAFHNQNGTLTYTAEGHSPIFLNEVLEDLKNQKQL